MRVTIEDFELIPDREYTREVNQMPVLSSEEVAHMTQKQIEQETNAVTGWCESCQQEFIGVCAHYEGAALESAV